jgi:protein TonB
VNAHPQIANLAAGLLEQVVLPPPLGTDTLPLEIAPRRESYSPEKAPEVETPASAAPEKAPRPRWRTPAIIASFALHIAAAWAIGEHLAQGPLEADDPDAIAVELVVEPVVQQVPAASAAPGAVLADAGLDARGESPPTEIALPVPLPAFDPSLALTAPPVPRPVADIVAPAPAAETLAVLAVPPKIDAAGVPPPQPEARAAAPARPKTETPAKPKAEPARAPRRSETPAAKAKPAPSKTGKPDNSTARAKASAAGAGGHSAGNAQKPAGASASAKAAYGAKLLSHVQRFKRYPAAAAGATGVTRLSVTIGRDGSLRSARIVSGSGNASLDAEARATAGRAAPYPRPPDGIGGATLTFSVALKFTR